MQNIVMGVSAPQETLCEHAHRQYPASYQEIPYETLVHCLEREMGGEPPMGSRASFIYAMACNLRYVCDDDPEWIASIMPTYGEVRDKWRSNIDSACQRMQYKVMPQIMKRAIEAARQALASEVEDLPPAMPKKLPRLIAHLVKNVPEVCKPAVANAVFPALAAHLHGVKFRLIDNTEKEATFMCVTMAKQSSGKSSINKPIEYIMADIVERDNINRQREQEWKDTTAQLGDTKDKPQRPDDLCVQMLVSDMTNAAFVQRLKDAGDRYLYTNLEELELLKQLQTNGTKDVCKIVCLCFDNGKYGQERVGTQSVTARVSLRWNWNAASTIWKGRQFFKDHLEDGTLSRINFCTIIKDRTKPFVYGEYDDQYAEVLKPYIDRLNTAHGLIHTRWANALARRMREQCQDNALLSDDDFYGSMSSRAVTIAYLKAMVLYVANGMRWSKEIAEFALWSLEYDLWCKSHFFAEDARLKRMESMPRVKKPRGRANLLNLLPNQFSLQDARELRMLQGKDAEGAQQMLWVWVHRGYIERVLDSDLYYKTQDYLSRQAG